MQLLLDKLISVIIFVKKNLFRGKTRAIQFGLKKRTITGRNTFDLGD